MFPRSFLALFSEFTASILVLLGFYRDARLQAGSVWTETRPAVLSEPVVPPVAHRAPRRGEGERPEDPVHLPEGTGLIRGKFILLDVIQISLVLC